MKKLSITFCLLALVIVTNAQKVPLANSILWKISGNKLSKPSYILLTGPSCSTSFELPEKAKTILPQVQAIVAEFDLYGSKDAYKLASINETSVDSQKLKPNISNDEYQAYDGILKNAGYPDDFMKGLANYRIGTMSYLIKMTALPCGAGQEQLAYERELKPLAKKNKVDYQVLQSVDEVIGEFNAHSTTYWKNNIEYHLKNEAAVKSSLAESVTLYNAEKIISLSKLYTEKKYYQLQFDDKILETHSRFLTEHILQQMNTISGLFTIDISNVLYADRSVFEMLHAQGYEVTPVTQ